MDRGATAEFCAYRAGKHTFRGRKVCAHQFVVVEKDREISVIPDEAEPAPIRNESGVDEVLAGV